MKRGWETEAKAMWADGATAQAIADRFGVSKNTLIGLRHRRKWIREAKPCIRGRGYDRPYRGDTLMTRLDALHAKFEAAMAGLTDRPSFHYTVPAAKKAEA